MVRPVQDDRPVRSRKSPTNSARRSTIAKLNIDDNPDAPGKYGVRGIPTMILFKNGEEADTKVGAAPKSALKGWLENAL